MSETNSENVFPQTVATNTFRGKPFFVPKGFRLLKKKEKPRAKDFVLTNGNYWTRLPCNWAEYKLGENPIIRHHANDH